MEETLRNFDKNILDLEERLLKEIERQSDEI
jgi:hypothetical protein